MFEPSGYITVVSPMVHGKKVVNAMFRVFNTQQLKAIFPDGELLSRAKTKTNTEYLMYAGCWQPYAVAMRWVGFSLGDVPLELVAKVDKEWHYLIKEWKPPPLAVAFTAQPLKSLLQNGWERHSEKPKRRGKV